MFPAALSSKPATMEAQAQGGWSRVAPEVWSSDAQRDSLPSASNFTPGQTGTSSAGGTPRLRTPSGSRLHPLPHSDLAVGLGIREGRAGDSSSGSAGIVCLSAVSLPAVSGPHFLVQEGAQRTCCAGPNPCAVLPGTRVGERDPHVLLFTSTGRVTRTREVVVLWKLSVPALRGLQCGRIGLQRQESFTFPPQPPPPTSDRYP